MSAAALAALKLASPGLFDGAGNLIKSAYDKFTGGGNPYDSYNNQGWTTSTPTDIGQTTNYGGDLGNYENYQNAKGGIIRSYAKGGLVKSGSDLADIRLYALLG